MSTAIIDRGRGPEIVGTRITVYAVLDYHRLGWHPCTIAATLGLSSEQVEAALRYITEHRDEVEAVYRRICERAARGNPPEIRARLEQSHQKLLAERDRLRAEKARANGVQAPRGQ